MIPRRGTIFGCTRCFHITASWWRIYETRQAQRERRTTTASITYFRRCPRIPLGIHPNTFDGNPRAIEDPFVYVTGASRSEGQATDAPKRAGKYVGRWEHRPSAAYASEFVQTLRESGSGRIETIDYLREFKRKVRKGDLATYLVQVVNEPRQIIAL